MVLEFQVLAATTSLAVKAIITQLHIITYAINFLKRNYFNSKKFATLLIQLMVEA